MAVTNLSNMFTLFSLGFAAPTIERARLVTSGVLVQDVCTTWRALELPEEALQEFVDEMAVFEGADTEETLHEIRRDYTYLFMLDRLVENTEGVWRKKAEGKKNSFYMINDISMGIQDFMQKCGVVRPEGYNESVDRIDNEWEFCSILAQDPEYLAESGLSAEEELTTFIEDHIKVWVPDMSDLLAKEARSAYYRAWAKLQKTFVEAL